MNETKSFIQYKGDSFSIRVKIGIKGNIPQKSSLYFFGEYKRKQDEKYRELNKKYFPIYRKQYRKNNKEKLKRAGKKYYKNNKEKLREKKKKYKKSDKGKESIRKSQAKRKGFGFNPLNNPFPNCEGHHLNYEYVIFIPKDLHRSIQHSVIHNRNMHEINTLAIDYYWEEKFKKYGVIK